MHAIISIQHVQCKNLRRLILFDTCARCDTFISHVYNWTKNKTKRNQLIILTIIIYNTVNFYDELSISYSSTNAQKRHIDGVIALVLFNRKQITFSPCDIVWSNRWFFTTTTTKATATAKKNDNLQILIEERIFRTINLMRHIFLNAICFFFVPFALFVIFIRSFLLNYLFLHRNLNDIKQKLWLRCNFSSIVCVC